MWYKEVHCNKDQSKLFFSFTLLRTLCGYGMEGEARPNEIWESYVSNVKITVYCDVTP
jgi:hypothetical protein